MIYANLQENAAVAINENKTSVQSIVIDPPFALRYSNHLFVDTD